MLPFKIHVTKLVLKGVKNLDEEITLDFGPTQPNRKTPFEKYNVKAIYGMNGSGKSGIIQAMNIYKTLLRDENALTDADNIKYISEMINKKSNEMKIEVEFFYCDEDKKRSRIYSHEIILSNYENDVVIEKEKICSKAFSKNCKWKVAFCSEKGKYVDGILSDDTIQVTTNLLDKNSIIKVLERKKIFGNYDEMKLVHIFSMCINVDRAHEDEHEKSIGLSDENFAGAFVYFDSNVISKKRKDNYLDYMSDVEQFVKLFKPDLKKIEVKFTKVTDETFAVERFFVYDNYSINFAYESTGVKKIVRLFSDIRSMSTGLITFIDEFDANINDVYLLKLVEYVATYGKGQLIFTTHNVSPMKMLKGKKKAIDFLTQDGRIVSATRRGNYSLENLYREGMIEGLPFNIEAFEFLSIFQAEGDENE